MRRGCTRMHPTPVRGTDCRATFSVARCLVRTWSQHITKPTTANTWTAGNMMEVTLASARTFQGSTTASTAGKRGEQAETKGQGEQRAHMYSKMSCIKPKKAVSRAPHSVPTFSDCEDVKFRRTDLRHNVEVSIYSNYIPRILLGTRTRHLRTAQLERRSLLRSTWRICNAAHNQRSSSFAAEEHIFVQGFSNWQLRAED